MQTLKISIITVCYNSAATIAETIQSIASQNYPGIEYIVVDGGSTDGTDDIIKNSAVVTKLISEPDNGIYDAMNKGLQIATGEVIGILNADDFYARNDAVSLVANEFKHQNVDACYADLVYVDQQNTSKIVRYWKSGTFKRGLFKRGWMPAHPTFFCRKSVYEKYGKFNLNFKIAADVELLFRFLEQYAINTVYLPRTLIKMRLGGTTNQSWKNIKLQNKEVLLALDRYYGKVSRALFFMGKLLNRSTQFFRKPKDI